mgnify:FL=1
MTAPRRLFRRLVGSHLALTACISLVWAFLLFGFTFLVEDYAHTTVVSAALEGEVPLRVWRAEDAPHEVRALADGRPDGVRELDVADRESHVGLGTDADGTRWIAVLDLQEVQSDWWIAARLVGGILLLSVGALAVGWVVARRTVAPLERLTARLRSSQPPTPEDLARDAGDDEIGFLARELARFLDERERALAREREFLRDASHELRNPLGVLQGALELLRETGPGDAPVFEERLNRLGRSVERMRGTVEGLLDLARQENEAAYAAGAPLDTTVADLIDEFEAAASGDVRFRLRIDGVPAGRPELWIVILRNLLDNALHATEQGRIDVHLGSHRVSVDTGRGMDAALIEDVTATFRRGPSSRGFGLGLAIVQRLARRLDWELEITSSDRGTTVALVKNGAGRP